MAKDAFASAFAKSYTLLHSYAGCPIKKYAARGAPLYRAWHGKHHKACMLL
jgi:hypothetical protein